MLKHLLKHASVVSAAAGALLYTVGLQLPFFSYDLRTDSARLSAADFQNLVIAGGTGEGTLPFVLVLLIAAAVASVRHRELRRAARVAAVLMALVSVGLLFQPVTLARSEPFRYSGDGFAVPPGPGFYVLTMAVLVLAVSPFLERNRAGIAA